ncbi:MAG: (2Fe-2S)-binding protein [Salinarimonadaceae bacterium]|nr:MAG: (2Fe-2S)-binding protein [Salinarimonadaceae bacterium]
MITLTVNGEPRSLDVDPEMPLLWALRDHAGLTGAKYSCGIARCGACLVLVDGAAMPSCVVRVSDVEGASITTIEGVGGEIAEAVIDAWTRHDVAQCGYCQPGQVIRAIDLLQNNRAPSDAEIADAMDPNICRCGTYQRIANAVRDAARALG